MQNIIYILNSSSQSKLFTWQVCRVPCFAKGMFGFLNDGRLPAPLKNQIIIITVVKNQIIIITVVKYQVIIITVVRYPLKSICTIPCWIISLLECGWGKAGLVLWRYSSKAFRGYVWQIPPDPSEAFYGYVWQILLKLSVADPSVAMCGRFLQILLKLSMAMCGRSF